MTHLLRCWSILFAHPPKKMTLQQVQRPFVTQLSTSAPSWFFGDISAQSEASATVKLSPASWVLGPPCVAADRDHRAVGGTATEVARVNSTLKNPTAPTTSFFCSFLPMPQLWFMDAPSPHTETTAMTKVSATSYVYGPSYVVVDTDQEADGRSEVVSARVVDKREK